MKYSIFFDTSGDFMKKSKFLTVVFSLFLLSGLNAQEQFTGVGGGRINFTLPENNGKIDPSLTTNIFFQSQIGFSENLWAHASFSLNTSNILKNSLICSTPSTFQIDEVAFTYRAKLDNTTNYLSVFYGSLDPIGSDIFLQRQFGLRNVTSRTTDNWLSASSKNLYPHYGAGISDVIQLGTPHALGGYIYLNHEANEQIDYIVLNTDIRYACTLPYFTVDFATGIGAPLKNNYKADDVIMVIDSLFWHTGLTLIGGNNYTQSIYLQTGIYNAEFSKSTKKLSITNDNIFFLLEPRFLAGASNIHISLFSVPKAATENQIFMNDTLGINVNFFKDNTNFQSNAVKRGIALGIGFEDKSFMDFKEIAVIFNGNINYYITPYMGFKVFGGEFNTVFRMNMGSIFRKDMKAYEGITIAAGYKAQF